MVTLTVDDRQLIVASVNTILQRLDPEGVHLGAYSGEEALQMALDSPLDAAFLDVQMPGIDGIALARRLQERYPLINIIFITGYKDYTLDAFELFASAYILKPVTEAKVAAALSHLRYNQVKFTEGLIRARCFGNFEVYHGEEPINFARSKSKELLAYLIDRNGAACTNDMIIGNLWPDKEPSEGIKSVVRTLTNDLRSSLEAVGAGSVIRKGRDELSVDVTKIDCDYFRLLQGDPIAIHQFRGEYMEQYEFAEETRYNLQTKMKNW